MNLYQSPTHTPTPLKTLDRSARIQTQIEKFQQGNNVKSSELKAALGKVGWNAYQKELCAMSPRPMTMQDISELKRYQDAVHTADRVYYRTGNKVSRTLSPKQRFKRGLFRHDAESAYERAFEILEDLVSTQPWLARFFDRPLVFGQLGDLSHDPEGAPRLNGSRSPYTMMHGTPAIDAVRSFQQAWLINELQSLDWGRPADAHHANREIHPHAFSGLRALSNSDADSEKTTLHASPWHGG